MRIRWRRENSLYTTPDRAGLAIATGGLIGGVLIAALVAMGPSVGPIMLLVAFVAGSIASAFAIAAAIVPLWAVLRVIGRQHLGHAALACGLMGFAVGLFAQTYGFGLYPAPPSDVQSLLFRWASAGATSAMIGLVGAGIGAIMWRIAYRES